jgi:radical SAM protein with 4Fe4S-binding SPASM domain
LRFDRVYIEVSNICNLKCHFCPEVERAQQILSIENFENIVSQVKDFTDQVCLHVMGEPLAHPQFSKLISICTSHNLKVQITTNATLLNAKNLEALLSPSVRQVNISLQSFAANLKPTDEQTQLDRYLKAIFNFTDLVRLERPDLYVQFRMWNEGAIENEREEQMNEKMLASLEQHFSRVIDQSKINLRFKKTAPLGGRFSVQFDSRFRWPNLSDEMITDQGFCHALTSHIAIHADGTIVPCCLDKEARINLGNIYETAFSEVLKSPRLQAMKLGFASGVLCESLCQRCDFISRFQTKAARLRESQLRLKTPQIILSSNLQTGGAL